MNKKRLKQHSPQQQAHYEREARLAYGPGVVNESIARWGSYSQARQDEIIAEGEAVYSELAEAMAQGHEAGHSEVTALLDRWQAHLRHFYEPSLDMLRGLGQLYNSHPEFIANFQQLHVDLPAWLERVIAEYVDELETAELERMLAEDEQRAQRLSQ
ncbi:MAG: TipAS antibiotic-recognition domain-containing protein [Chloroflexi bacterium]|nr:TipAS antibiotic-recognition domain-containing protein [Chloroflexota bacterium]MCY4246866.1 TipAS antibiotic-recognition domain-containing protein [Chloroflexota bacterium]